MLAVLPTNRLPSLPDARVTAATARSRGSEECPLCPPPNGYPAPQDRHPNLREHLIAAHDARELADALILVRSEAFARNVTATVVRVSRVEHARSTSPLSRAILDAWPGGVVATGEVADLVGEREARTLVALRRLASDRVLVRVGVGRWRMA